MVALLFRRMRRMPLFFMAFLVMFRLALGMALPVPAEAGIFPGESGIAAPAATVAVGAASPSREPGLPQTIPGLPNFLAQGDRGVFSSEPQGGDGSVMDQYLGGSFVGALLFGYPYTGFGMADIVLLAVLAYFAVRALLGGVRGEGDDRLSGGRDGSGSTRSSEWSVRDEDEDEEEHRAPRGTGARREDRRPPSSSGGPANPRDNAWSRRLRERYGEDEQAGGPGARRSDVGQPRRDSEPPLTARRRAEAMWKHLSSQPEEHAEAPETAASVAAGAHVPAGFDVSDFLEGARALYARLQNAWAERKVDDLAPFTTPEMLRLLQDHAAANPDPESVDVILVNATLNDVVRKDGEEEARVHFAVIMRMGDAAHPSEIEEIWRFVRGAESNGMWQLAGIEAA